MLYLLTLTAFFYMLRCEEHVSGVMIGISFAILLIASVSLTIEDFVRSR